MNKHVETVEKTFELIDLGATLEETRHWCKDHGYGKGDDFGRVGLCVWSLSPYNKHFENQIGMGVLKSMKGPEDWFLEMRKINNHLAKIAGDLRAAQAGITPAVKLEDIAKRVDESRFKSLGPRAVLTKDTQVSVGSVGGVPTEATWYCHACQAAHITILCHNAAVDQYENFLRKNGW